MVSCSFKMIIVYLMGFFFCFAWVFFWFFFFGCFVNFFLFENVKKQNKIKSTIYVCFLLVILATQLTMQVSSRTKYLSIYPSSRRLGSTKYYCDMVKKWYHNERKRAIRGIIFTVEYPVILYPSDIFKRMHQKTTANSNNRFILVILPLI